ncbi:MAG: hypothetical protein ACYSWZ_23400 [Planctomycetota bacterium]|jgi:hypothetical protein
MKTNGKSRLGILCAVVVLLRFISPLQVRIFYKNMNIGKLLRVYYVRIVCCCEAILMGISIWINTGPALLLGLKMIGTYKIYRKGAVMAYSKSFRKSVITVLAVLMIVGSAWATDAAKKTRDRALQMLPAETLFCVRINNLDSTTAAVNEYLKGVAPDSLDVKDEVLSKLAKRLGGKKPRGVNVKGTFVIFGVNLPSKESEVNPFANLFVGALVPINNYKTFISKNPNVGEADDEGISKLTVDGKEEAIAIRKGRFAVMCPPRSRDKLIRFKKMRVGRKRGLAALLDESEKDLLRASPICMYGKMIFTQIEAMKGLLKMTQEQGKTAMVNPAAIIDFYVKMFEVLLKGTDRLALGIVPTAEKCTFTLQCETVDDTLLAQLLTAPEGGDLSQLIGYLENGAFANVITKVDRKGMKLGYMKMFDLFASISPDAMSKAETEKLKKLTTRFINAIAISMKSGGEKSGPFSFKYVIQVKDEQAFKEVIEEEFKMIEEGMFDKMYKAIGLDINLKIERKTVERKTATYRGVDIDSAILSFKMGDEDSKEAEMIDKIWGKGLQYRLAILDGYCAYTFGGDSNKIIRSLIDQIKAGGPDELASEIETAIDVLEDGDEDDDEEYDFGGTVNIVRMLNMASGFIAASGGPQIKPLDMLTKSNIVFAGRSREGKLLVEPVGPERVSCSSRLCCRNSICSRSRPLVRSSVKRWKKAPKRCKKRRR